MEHLKLFEAHRNSEANRLLSGTSKEFWEMVNIANWQKVINSCQNRYDDSQNRYDNRECNDAEKHCKARIYLKYKCEEVEAFNIEMHNLYRKLYDYFKPYWLGEKKLPGYNGYCVSDDGYWDLLSSVIGKGKSWVIKCIKDPSLPAEMAKTNDYVENFSDLLNVDKEKYHEIKVEFDPFYRDVSKFNL